MSGSEADDVVTINDDDTSSRSPSSNIARKKTALSSQAQTRMSILSTACKKHEFVPFTKDGHTLFVKFTIDMEEKSNSGSVATFVIRLLVEGYWTLFVHGKKLQKSHKIYPLFSCDNSRASSSKNYKLDISKVDDLFGYLNDCIFCVGHPEFYRLARNFNRGDGLTVIPLASSKDAEAVEVLRNVKWREKNYPSTLVHKNCELIKCPKDGTSDSPIPAHQIYPTWFRCQSCDGITAILNDMNEITNHPRMTHASTPSDIENLPSNSNDGYSSTTTAPMRRKSGSPAVSSFSTGAQTNGSLNLNNDNSAAPVDSPALSFAASPAPAIAAPITFLPPDPNGPSYLMAKNEEGRFYVLLSSAGDVFCGLCAPNPFKFPRQHETVSYNEHLWMKHHVFIDSISIWCDICHKPFFDKGRFRTHVQRDHPGQA